MRSKSIAELLNGTSRWDDGILRELAEYSDWFVPVDKNSCAMIWTIDGVCHWPAQKEKSVPADGNFDWLEMRGRHLVSVLPDEVERIVFDWGKDREFIVDGIDLERLRNIAAALDCEDAIDTPGLEGGVDALLSHDWLVLCDEEKPSVRFYRGLESICAFTAIDSLQDYCRAVQDQESFSVRVIKGTNLFQDLEARSDWDCLWINPQRDSTFEILSPGQIYELIQHREPRAEGRILKARTIAEIHRFLDERGMLEDGRQHSMHYVGNEMVANYSGKIVGSESDSFNFYPVSDSGSDFDWGEGATEILCTGLLADVLRRRLELIEELPIPLSASDSEYVQMAILWARELIKTLNNDDSELSRRTQRTADGARFIREMPHIKTRSFMEHAIEYCDSAIKNSKQQDDKTGG